MADDVDKKRQRWCEAAERGSWRQTLRANFAPLFDDLDFGFQCGDGWAEIICAMAAELAGIVGSPARAPQLRVVPLKEELGPLRVSVRGMPEAQAAAVHAAITRAEEKSVQICKAWTARAACANRATATVTRPASAMSSTDTGCEAPSPSLIGGAIALGTCRLSAACSAPTSPGEHVDTRRRRHRPDSTSNSAPGRRQILFLKK